MPERFTVEIVFALPEKQRLVEFEAHTGMTAAAAVTASGILDQFAGVDLETLRLGIWGKEVCSDQLLKQGDRVELYRALQVEPREARRLRAAREPGSTPGHGESR